MADPKGVYFGPNNTGFATILPDSDKPTVLDYAIKLEGQKARDNQLRQKQAQDGLKDIKNFESWRYYTPAINQRYTDLINDIKKGGIDPVDLKMRANELANLSNTSMQLQGEFKAAQGQYKSDKKVSGAEEWYINKYHSNPTTDHLNNLSTQGVDPYKFLDEQGGSQYINSTEAFQDVINTSFKDFVKRKDETDPSRKYIGRGLQQVTQEQFESEFRSFAQIDPKTGNIAVKDIDQLIDDGVLSVFLEDPYTKRIIEDAAAAKSGDGPVDDNVRAEVLRDMLAPRTGGKTSNTKSFSTARENFDVNAGANRRADQGANWLKDARRSDPNAWSRLKETVTSTGDRIKDVTVLDSGDVLLVYDENIPDAERERWVNKEKGPALIPHKMEIIRPKDADQQDLLRFYDQTERFFKTGYGEIEDLGLNDIMQNKRPTLNDIMND